MEERKKADGETMVTDHQEDGLRIIRGKIVLLPEEFGIVEMAGKQHKIFNKVNDLGLITYLLLMEHLQLHLL